MTFRLLAYCHSIYTEEQKKLKHVPNGFAIPFSHARPSGLENRFAAKGQGIIGLP
jgi:hypothetical protein